MRYFQRQKEIFPRTVEVALMVAPSDVASGASVLASPAAELAGGRTGTAPPQNPLCLCPERQKSHCDQSINFKCAETAI